VLSPALMVCTTVPGVGRDLVFSVLHNGVPLALGTGSYTTRISYAAPLISSAATDAISGFSTLGGDIVAISGKEISRL
jgi:hypothetical protein